eukprot:PhF_6_TR14083/c1_g1_i2/m.22498
MAERLILAEAFDMCHDAEDKEKSADTLQQQIAKSSSKDFSRVRKMYAVAYDTYIRGLDRFNKARKLKTIDDASKEIIKKKMVAYMDRCDLLRDKESCILMHAQSVVDYGKEGWVVMDTLYHRDPSDLLKSNEEIQWSKDLGPGAYNVTIRNLTTTSFAAPTPRVLLQVDGKRFTKEVPSMTAWSRNIGVAKGESRCSLKILSDSWMRPLNIAVDIVILKCTTVGGGGDQTWVAALPEIPTHTPTKPQQPVPPNPPPPPPP